MTLSASYGIVGLAFISILLTVLLFKFHRMVLAMRGRRTFPLAALLLSVLVSNLLLGIVFQSHINIFPGNYFFWLCAGILASLLFEQQQISDSRKPVAFATALPRGPTNPMASVKAAQSGAPLQWSAFRRSHE